MIKFKNEVGIAEVFSFLALVISGFALFESSKANDGFIVEGGGLVQTALIHDDESNQCQMLLAFPHNFHNSGKKSVSLKQLTPSKDLNTVFFTSSGGEHELNSLLYFSKSGEEGIPQEWHLQVKSMREFKPSYNHISDLIKPGESYNFYTVISVNLSDIIIQENSFAYLAFNAIFSNGQEFTRNNAVSLNTNMKCKSS
ncbi:hypothetical protein HWQ46_01785 [Shewanella sp. D64]|uniref:hypothetical protein n=1 Tax=unclassified Shewanella TaxID=196818 RepID=UPI0022BA2001|nr:MULTISPECIES: hypothetical protein [unclassified Shewanella]MEC4724278.1 hypothetical protein [Shewanella sp. D64]MEC4738790.1 hypothetical protein [Shewanella sp. E94]WBJ97770.1 hypothetical protein HWQ47_12070 [Shewanella sp. MTB7]